MSPQKIGWMVDDDYTNKEEAIEFNNRDDNDNDDDDGNNDGNDKDDDDDDDDDDKDDDDDDDNKDDDKDNDDNGDLYIPEVATTVKKRKKGARLKSKLSTSKKRHKSKGTNNTSINHDSVMLSGKGDRIKTEVPCPAQTQDYCETFHQIDKGNGAEANYDLGGKSHLHNWSPKLIFLFQQMYKALVKQHTPERRFLGMDDAVRELTHNLCQRGPAMRQRRAEHPSWTQDMSKFFGWNTGRKVRSDAKGMMTVQSVMPREEPLMDDTYALLKNQQRRLPWCVHQSEAMEKYARCQRKPILTITPTVLMCSMR